MNTFNSLSRLAAVFAITVCTALTGDLLAQDEESGETENYLEVETLAEIPVGITSFGAAVCDGHLYTWGGHGGAAHEYYRMGQNPVLRRLNLKDPTEWETVHEAKQGRQGLAMVAHDGKLFRLGGFEAHNERGEDQDLHSVATFDMFDPATGKWTELATMPEPRSSFDAVVMGDKLYIVGGWALAGEGNTEWSETAYSFDLSNSNSEWEALPTPPFQRRALSTAWQGDNLYVIGGMQQKGGPTRKVAIFNTKSGEWSDGPELPGEEGMEGFGNSSFNVGGTVYVTTYGGHVHKLNSSGDAWENVGSLETGRFFHRLLPISDDKFALVGGANMESGKSTDVEVISVNK